MKKFLMILAATIMLAQPTWAASWELIGIGETNGNQFYIDKDSIKVNRFKNGGSYITAWRKVEQAKPYQWIDNQQVWQNKAFAYYDCSAKKTTFDYMVLYDEQGKYIHSANVKTVSTQSSTSWERAVPDSISESALNYVCSQAKQ